jgi:hypothetical protein
MGMIHKINLMGVPL